MYPHSQAGLRHVPSAPFCYLFSCWGIAPKTGWAPGPSGGATPMRGLLFVALVCIVLWAVLISLLLLILQLA